MTRDKELPLASRVKFVRMMGKKKRAARYTQMREMHDCHPSLLHSSIWTLSYTEGKKGVSLLEYAELTGAVRQTIIRGMIGRGYAHMHLFVLDIMYK